MCITVSGLSRQQHYIMTKSNKSQSDYKGLKEVQDFYAYRVCFSGLWDSMFIKCYRLVLVHIFVAGSHSENLCYHLLFPFLSTFKPISNDLPAITLHIPFLGHALKKKIFWSEYLLFHAHLFEYFCGTSSQKPDLCLSLKLTA